MWRLVQDLQRTGRGDEVQEPASAVHVPDPYAVQNLARTPHRLLCVFLEFSPDRPEWYAHSFGMVSPMKRVSCGHTYAYEDA